MSNIKPYVRALGKPWGQELYASNAEAYVYRLYDQEGWPVGRWGPSVAFTRRQALDYMRHSIDHYWVRCGELIYSVE